MPLFQGSGGAVFDIDSPDPAQVESGELVPVESQDADPPRKRTPRQPKK